MRCNVVVKEQGSKTAIELRDEVAVPTSNDAVANVMRRKAIKIRHDAVIELT